MFHIFSIKGTESCILFNPLGKYQVSLPLRSCHIFRLFAIFCRSNVQSIFITQLIGDRLEFIFPVTLVILELISCYHIYTVYYNMGMKMISICVNSHHSLILSAKCLFCKTHGYIIHNLWCPFARF